MHRSTMSIVLAVVSVVALGACGSSYKSGSSATSSTPSSSAASSSASSSSAAIAVKSASNAKVGGTVLVDAQGMTLYALSAEQKGKFICSSSSCTAVWHPLTVPAGGHLSGSVGSLSTIKRPDGTMQATYRGQPLYTFAQDAKPGDAAGQGFKDVGTWSAVKVSGTGGSAAAASAARTPAPASTSPAPAPAGSSNSSPYGY